MHHAKRLSPGFESRPAHQWRSVPERSVSGVMIPTGAVSETNGTDKFPDEVKISGRYSYFFLLRSSKVYKWHLSLDDLIFGVIYGKFRKKNSKLSFQNA